MNNDEYENNKQEPLLTHQKQQQQYDQTEMTSQQQQRENNQYQNDDEQLPQNPPPLIRQRPSLRRRNAQDMAQNQGEVGNLVKHNSQRIAIEVLLACFFGIGLLASQYENESCKLQPRQFVSKYLNAFLVPLMLSRVFLNLVVSNHNLFIVLFLLISGVGAIAETWFTLYGMTYIFSENCHGFYLHYFNSLFIVLYGLNVAVIVCVMATLLVCCLPCICMALMQRRSQQITTQKIKETLINSLVRTKYDNTAFKNDECAICLGKFDDDSEVTPLPCDIRHYFHTDCITDWFRQNNVCPLCKTQISKQDMDKLQQDLPQKMEEQRHHQ
eukprot:403373898